MPTIIDSLIVTLGLDPTKFVSDKNKVDKGLKDTGAEADKAGAKLKKAGKDGAEGFQALTKSATAFLTLIGGTVAIKRFVQQTVESSAAIDRLSKNLNVSVENISAWSNAAELAGGSADGLQGTLDLLSKSQTELQLTGQTSMLPYLSALGVAMTDVRGKARPVNDMLADLAGRFSKMDRVTANNMGRMMGLDQGTMNLLLKGRTEVEMVLKRQKESNVLTKQQAEEASRLKKAMVESRQSFEAFGRSLLSSAMPALEKLFAMFSDFGVWVSQNKEFVKTFLAILTAGLLGLGAALIPINLAVVAVTALAGAVALLYQDYQTFKRGGDSLIDWSKWEPGIKAAGEGIKWLHGLIGDLMYRMIAMTDMFDAVIKKDMARARFAAREFMNGKGGTPAAAGTGSVAPQQGGVISPITGKPLASGGSGAAGKMAALEGKYGLPAGLLDSVWNTESSRGKHMKSSAGAEGHFQFMPATAKQYGLDNPYDFDQSADAAARYYRDLLKRYNGDVGKAAAAYNWGMGNVDRKGLGNAPAETRGYMSKVLGGIPGAAMAARGAGASSGLPTTAEGSRSVQTTIGEVKVYTAATNAAGIAKDLGNALDYTLTSQANYGLN